MEKLIFISDAADELNIFYRDLLVIMDHESMHETKYAKPDDSIPYSYVEYIREQYAKTLPVEPTAHGKFNPAQWKPEQDFREREQDIEDKYNLWFDEWVINHSTEYAEKYRSYKNYLKSINLIIPDSYESFCLKLKIYYEGDYLEFNKFLTGSIDFDLFKLYHDIIRQHVVPLKKRERATYIKNAPVKSGCTKEPTKYSRQVALYCAYLLEDSVFLKSERYLKFKGPQAFIINEGRKRGVSGPAVKNYCLTKLKDKKSRLEQLNKGKRGCFFIEEAIKLLSEDDVVFEDAIRIAMTERDIAFPPDE